MVLSNVCLFLLTGQVSLNIASPNSSYSLPSNKNVDEKAMTRNRDTRIPHLVLDTKWERNTHILDCMK